MTDFAVSWAIAGATIAFLVYFGWRNHRMGYRRRIRLEQWVQPVLPKRECELPPMPPESEAGQLARLNRSLQAKSIALHARQSGKD